MYTHTVTQPMPAGQRGVPQYSSTHPHIPHPPVSTGNDIHSPPQAKFHIGDGDPISQSENQSLPDAMKSISSDSSVGSGGGSVGGASVSEATSGPTSSSRAEDYSRSPSELLYPISDQEDQDEQTDG